MQPFRFVERASLQRLVLYLNPGLGNNDIPKKSVMANAVMEKVEKLDAIDRELIAVRGCTVSILISHAFSEYSVSYIGHMGWLVNKAPPAILLLQYPIYLFAAS
jgi:hypothetical protein